MKKTIVIVTLILVVAVVSVPFVSGLLMEKTVRRAVEDMNALYAATGAGYSLEIIDYNRTYLTSDIQWKIDFGALKAFYHVDEMVFSDHAKHGFTGVVATTSLEKNPWYTAFVAEHLQGNDPIRISTVYGLFGAIESTIALDAFSVSVDGEMIDVKPGSLVITTGHNLKNFRSSGTWQGLSVDDSLAIGETSMASNLEMLSTFIWDGDFSFGVQNVYAHEKETQFELKEMQGKYLLNVDEDQTSMSGEALFSIDGLNAKNMAIDNASVRMAAKGVNVAGYEAFMKMYSQMMSEFLGNMASAEEDPEKAKEVMNRQMAAVGFQMMAAYEQLLKAGLEFRISDLQVNMADGDIAGDITLGLLKDMTIMQFAPIVGQPELLLDIFYLKSDLSLPVGLTGENPKLLSPVYPGMQTGLFIKKGDHLVHRAETVDGKLMVNGAEIPLTR